MATKKWVSIKNLFPRTEGKRFQIDKIEITPERVKEEKFRAMIRGSYREVHSLEAGIYTKLIDKELNQIVMSDTPMELETNEQIVDEARGRVLIGGLGLGIILLAIQKKKEVKEIIIIEKYQEVIDLVQKRLPLNSKVKIICGDILDLDIYDKRLGSLSGFDTIYFDIWNFISGDNWEEMKKLRRKYKRLLNKDGFIGSWRDKDCQRLNREDKY